MSSNKNNAAEKCEPIYQIYGNEINFVKDLIISVWFLTSLYSIEEASYIYVWFTLNLVTSCKSEC